MDTVVRCLVIYVFLILVFRVLGKRTLAETTTFDFVLLLIISETTQQALMGDDFSVSGALVAVATLLGLDLALSLLKQKFPKLDKAIDSVPLLIVQDGQPIEDRLQKERMDREDILEEARYQHGLERMDQIKYAILERDGRVSIIPMDAAKA